MKNKIWFVTITEYEYGWGSRVDEIKSFKTFEEAKAFTMKYNGSNNEKNVPTWYMAASDPYQK